MPKIKHLAIRTEDTGKLATFYMDVFEMQMLHKEKNEGGAIFLTDGYFNLAILPNHEQNAPNGLYHFGFEVESGEKIVERMKKVNPNKLPKGASQRPSLRRDPRLRSRWQLFRHLRAWLSECRAAGREKELTSQPKR